jgi:hypothetical protein
MVSKYLILLLVLFSCALKQPISISGNAQHSKIYSIQASDLARQSISIHLHANKEQQYQKFKIPFRNELSNAFEFKRVNHSHNDCIIEFPLNSIVPQQLFYLNGAFEIDFKDKKEVQRHAILDIMCNKKLHIIDLNITIRQK